MSTRARWRAGVQEFYDNVSHETVHPMAPVLFEDEFCSAKTGDLPTTEEFGFPWKAVIVGAAPPKVTFVADSANGIVECALTSASQAQSADMYANDSRQYDITKGLVVEWIINLSVLPTSGAEIVWGLMGDRTAAYDSATYSAFFTADGSGEIICEVDDNANDQSATSGITATNSQTKICRIDFTDRTDVRFYIDGVHVATGTTFTYAATGANAVVQPFLGCYKASGAGVGTIKADKVKIWGDRS